MRTSLNQPPEGTPLNMGNHLAQSLAGCWLLDEGGGTIAKDKRGKNDGTLTNFGLTGTTSNWVPFIKGKALNFDGTNDYVSVSALLGLTNSGTVHCIFKCGAIATNRSLVSNINGSTNRNGYYLSIGTTGLIRWIAGSASTSTQLNSATTLVAGNIYTVTVSWISGSINMYLNGVLDASTTGATVPTDAGNTLLIGANAVAVNNFFNSTMSTVMLFNNGLVSTDVRNLYLNPYQMFQNARPLKLAV